VSENEKNEVAESNDSHTERAKAYTAATTALRTAHADEFRSLLHAEYALRGITVKPRLTPEERAAREAEAVAAKAAKAEAKRLAKVAALEAEIAALNA
jgi:hypothetical protein